MPVRSEAREQDGRAAGPMVRRADARRLSADQCGSAVGGPLALYLIETVRVILVGQAEE